MDGQSIQFAPSHRACSVAGPSPLRGRRKRTRWRGHRALAREIAPAGDEPLRLGCIERGAGFAQIVVACGVLLRWGEELLGVDVNLLTADREAHLGGRTSPGAPS